MLTSTRNPKVQHIRRLQADAKARRQAGAFVVEGVRLAEEALRSGWPAELVLYDPELGERGLVVVKGFAAQGAEVEAAAPHVLQAASDTQAPQGLLAVLRLRPLPLPETLDFVFIADGVRDPGNLGSMLRTAAAAGVQAVLLPPGTADPFAPKVLRAGMGAHFRLPVLAAGWDEIAGLLQQHNLPLYLAAAEGEMDYSQADLRPALALAVGSEAEGAGQEARRLAAARLSISMPGKMESLNAASAAAVLLFEVVRQRQSSPASKTI